MWAKPFCIATEIQGGHHYCLGPKGLTLRGADELKEASLAKYGILMLHVPNAEVITIVKNPNIQGLDSIAKLLALN